MAASRQEVYFMALRMQTGAIRRELSLIGLTERAQSAVLERLDAVDAQVREWGVSGLVVEAQLQELLAHLLALPRELRTLMETGGDVELVLGVFEELGTA